MLHSYYTTTIPIDLFRLPDCNEFDDMGNWNNNSDKNNNNNNLEDPLLANSGVTNANRDIDMDSPRPIGHAMGIKKKSTMADLGSNEAKSLHRKGSEIATGWRILTWQGLGLQLYFMGSQLIGIEELGVTSRGHVFFFCLYVIVHFLIVTVAIRLCRWFLRELNSFAESPPIGDVAIPLLFGFFAIIFRWWHIPCTLLMIVQPEALDLLLSLTWKDSVIWIFQGSFVIIEMYAIYLMFKIVFLKHIPIDSKKLTPKQHLIVLHVYYAILAYGTITIFISIISVFFNAKMFYQFMLSLDFAIYGKYIVCDDYGVSSAESTSSAELTSSAETETETSDTGTEYSYCSDEVEKTYDAYYYFSLLFFFSLGRANSISFLWRTIGTVWDSLIERREVLVTNLSSFHLNGMHMGIKGIDVDHDVADDEYDNENGAISLKEMEMEKEDEHVHAHEHEYEHGHAAKHSMELTENGSQLSSYV